MTGFVLMLNGICVFSNLLGVSHRARINKLTEVITAATVVLILLIVLVTHENLTQMQGFGHLCQVVMLIFSRIPPYKKEKKDLASRKQ